MIFVEDVDRRLTRAGFSLSERRHCHVTSMTHYSDWREVLSPYKDKFIASGGTEIVWENLMKAYRSNYSKESILCYFRFRGLGRADSYIAMALSYSEMGFIEAARLVTEKVKNA